MSPLGLMLFFASWVGHSAIWLVVLNVLYSQPLSRSVLQTSRAIVAILVFGYPFALWMIDGLDLPGFPPMEWTLRSSLFGAYVGFTLLVSLVVIPAVTVSRRLRTLPLHVIEQQSHVVDYARELGGKPAGDGKYRNLARLPLNQVFQVEFTRLSLSLPRLPEAWNGLSILQLSDLHFCGTPSREFFEHVFDRCMQDGVPDILALTGDFVDSDQHHRWILKLVSRLQWNVAAFAILGNHDRLHEHVKVRRRLARSGITVLGNGWDVADVRGGSLLVVGHEGPWFGPPPDLSAAPQGDFRLCLSHTPDNIAWARRNAIDLMLSGHCHGGQIRLPVFGSLFVPSKFSRRFDQGLFFAPPTLLYVNRGLSGKEPLRYLCRPEVTRFILRRAAAKGS